MLISVYTDQCTDLRGRVTAVGVRAEVQHSPREGYDNAKIAALEQDLAEFVRERLWDAMTKDKS